MELGPEERMDADAAEAPRDACRPSAARARLAALAELFTRRAALAAAPPLTPTQRAHVALAEAALRVADHQLELVHAGDERATASAAVSLYREALHWALCALDGDATPARSLPPVFARLPRRRLAELAGGSVALHALAEALVHEGFVETAHRPRGSQLELADAARTFVHAVLAEAVRPDVRAASLRRQRVTRPLALIAVVAAMVAVATTCARTSPRRVDLADGRPFIVSATPAPAPVTGHVNRGLRGGHFFETGTQIAPWIRVDLGGERTIAEVVVENRRGCCEADAVPLVLEASGAVGPYRTLAERAQPFSTWEARFAPTRARYVRLRVAGRRTTLRLAGIHVYGP